MIGLIIQNIHWPLPFWFWPVPYGLPFWLILIATTLSERGIQIRGVALAEENGSLDKGSLRRIVFVTRSIRLLAAAASFAVPPWSMGVGLLIPYTSGLCMMICGSLLRQYCFRLLGASFTGAVAVPAGGKVIEKGIYRWVRHPSYTGGALYLLGIGTALTNWASLAIMAGGVVYMYLYRVHVEERALSAALGNEYRQYMARTKRFIPLLF